MIDLSVRGLVKGFEQGNDILKGITFDVNAGERVGILGRNGCGKTTFFRILSGELQPDAGTVSIASGRRLGLISQIPVYPDGWTTEDVLREAHRRLYDMEARMNELTARMASDNSPALLAEYDRLSENFRRLGGYDMEHERNRVANGLDIPAAMRAQPFDSLSGGEKTRVNLARLILEDTDILLLDEPTNHLDASGRRKLCDFVCGSRATILVVSHDAELLDLVGITCELTPQGLKVYGGNFAFCREQRQAEEAALERQVASAEAALQLARRKAREIRERQEKRMRAGERHKDGLPRILRKTFKDSGERTDSRLGDKHAGLVDDARQRLGELRRRRREACELKIDFDDARLHDGKLLVSARGVNVEHTPGHPLWRVPIDLEVRSGERILLAGDNGSGKTTLVRLLAGELQPSSGQVVRTAFSHVWLDQEYGMAATPRSVLELAQCHNSGGLPEHGLKMRLHRALFPEAMWDKRCDTLSGGERMRLCLCCLMISNSVPDLLVLDEPTNNLDLGSLGILARAIAGYRGTLLVVTHDRHFAREVGITRTVALPPPE